MALSENATSDIGSSGRRRARPNSTGKRDQIAKAALKVMLEVGVFGATTRKIADAAKLNVASLHYHFHDKEEIVFSVMESFVDNYRATLAEQFPPEQGMHDRIAALVKFVCGEIKVGVPEQLLLQEMTTYMLRHPYAKDLARAKDEHFEKLYTEVVSNVRDRDRYTPEQLQRISNLLYTSLIGLFNQWLARQNLERFDRGANDLVKSMQGFCDAILAES